MGLFSRFFGRKEDDDQESKHLVASKAEKALCLQLLLTKSLPTDPQQITEMLRGHHPSMQKARGETDPDLAEKGTSFGLVGWGKHVIRLVGFDLPMPAEVVERCVAPAHYGQELKEQARQHQAHLLLYYAGREEDPLEQYVALAAAAGAIGKLGGIVILNETAHTSFPAHALADAPDGDGDLIELLRSLPLLILYCGFVKMAGDFPGIWMRTYGCHVLQLPDLARLVPAHDDASDTFETFMNMLMYLRDSGATFMAGHTMQVGPDEFMKLRAPKDDEYFLESDGELFVLEAISQSEINR